jgi:cellulose synthase/poly-beta-1,6-N-acetylglucosamine synthase-like glycosyltransferase
MIERAINLLAGLSWPGFVQLFWFFIFLEVPRYILATLTAGWRYSMEPAPAPVDPRLPVSVLLGGHNEAEGLTATVRGLREQTHKNLEVVFADDGSTDDTPAIARDLQRKGYINRYVRCEVRGGKSSAMNAGLALCSNATIITLDVDTSLDRDAITRIVSRLLEHPANGAVSGNLGVRNQTASPWAAFQALEYLTTISMGRQFTDLFGILEIVSGAFGAFRRSAIEGVGGWEVGPGEDADITEKLRRAGWRIGFEPRAWALTDVPTTRKSLYNQRMRWSRSVIRFRARKFRGALDPRQSNFRLRDVIARLNNLFFQVFLSVSFVFYLFYIFIVFGDIAFTVMAAIHLVYILADVIEFLIICVVLRRPGALSLLYYVPAFTFYTSYFHRMVRLMAYLSELIFRKSYKDPYVPGKVRTAADQF